MAVRSNWCRLCSVIRLRFRDFLPTWDGCQSRHRSIRVLLRVRSDRQSISFLPLCSVRKDLWRPYRAISVTSSAFSRFCSFMSLLEVFSKSKAVSNMVVLVTRSPSPLCYSRILKESEVSLNCSRKPWTSLTSSWLRAYALNSGTCLLITCLLIFRDFSVCSCLKLCRRKVILSRSRSIFLTKIYVATKFNSSPWVLKVSCLSKALMQPPNFR